MALLLDPNAPVPAQDAAQPKTPGAPPMAGPASLPGNPPGNPIVDGSTETFVKDVVEASQQVPVIVDFWAPWCGPCKQLGPALEKLVRQAGGMVRLVKINVDENQELAAQMRVQSIPMVYAFHKGQVVDGFAGAVTESQLRQFMERLTGGAKAPIDLAIDEAKAMLEEGDAAGAIEVYREILAQDAANPAAIAGLIRALAQAGDVEQAKTFAQGLTDKLRIQADIAAALSTLELAEQADASGDVQPLLDKVAAEPKNHQARLDLAVALYAKSRNEEAIDALLEIVRLDRKWNDEAARKQLVKMFDALGPTDPLTVSGRRRLSSILFA